MPQTKRETGKLLSQMWGVAAKHALYRKDGKWYHRLTDFPGVLFDANGFVVFKTEQEYKTCPQLQIREAVHVSGGIASIPGYVRLTETKQLEPFSRTMREKIDQDLGYNVQPYLDEVLSSLEAPKALDLPEEPNEVRKILAQVYRIIRDTNIARRVKYVHGYRCQICRETIKLPNSGLYAEAHHIKPLGSKHTGPDVIENIVCVCPNHHVELDYGARRIDLMKLHLVSGHSISETYIDYHNTRIYGK
jgi:5-methylcytosine-specific restriction enzyme A